MFGNPLMLNATTSWRGPDRPMYGAAHSDFLWRSCSMLRTSVPSPRHRVRDFPCLVPSAGSYPV